MPHQSRYLPLLLALVLLVVAAPSAALAQAGERCFPETGHCIGGPIRTFWEQNGGLAVFGLPLGPQQEVAGEGGRPIQAQWFERHRLELHPENPAPYNVLLGRLGVDRLAQQGRDWRGFPPLDPNDADAERCRFFSETNHQVCDEFLQAFRSNGLSFAGRPGVTFEESLALFGLPISGPMTETVEGREYTVQWFERARFELHPANQPPYNVLFGRLGAELGGGRGADTALEGRQWRLVSFGPAGAPTPAVAEPASTLSFDGERASGNTGCNGFGGSYQASGGTIAFGPVISTLIACADEAVNLQEQAILTALQGAVPFTIAGDRLTLSYDGGRQALTYSSAPAAAGAALLGKEWRLASFGAAGAPTPAAGGRTATTTFDGERVGGSTGCNSFGGPYEARAGALTFGPLFSTAALCTDEALAAQERAILTALQGSVPYSVEGETLTISYDGGRQALTYSSAAVGGAADLVGRVWELASFGNPDAANLPAAGRPATLSFDGGQVGGSTGCNNLAGPYEATDERITFGALAVTRALCTDDDLARQEAAILGALQGEAPFTIVGDTLTISYDGGRQALTYRSIGAEPPPSR